MKKIFKYFLIAPLFCLLILQSTPIALGALDILDASLNTLKDTILFPITGGSVPDTTAEAVLGNTPLPNEITDLECPSGSQKMYTEDGSHAGCITGMLSVTRDNDNKVISGTCPGNGQLYYNKAGELAGCIVPPTKVARGSTSLKPFDLSKVGKATTGYKAKITIPCNTKIAGGTCPSQNTPAGYIARLYQFGLMIAGLVAFGAIIYGAVLYTLSAGNIGSKEDAKDQMLQAIYGLLLLMGAYLILYTINPSLVNLSNPTLEIPNATQEGYKGYTKTNTPAESDGTQIEGCASSSTGALDNLISFEVTAENESASTASTELKCTECLEGNDLVEEKCNCQTNLSRQFNGVCCKSTEATYKGACTSCSYFQQFKDDNTFLSNSAEEKSNINKICNRNFK